jgi:hypothetical protein
LIFSYKFSNKKNHQCFPSILRLVRSRVEGKGKKKMQEAHSRKILKPLTPTALPRTRKMMLRILLIDYI